MEGWIKLHRKLTDNPLWKCEKFTRGQAWVDLLLLANHEYGYFYLRNHKIEIQRGQVGYSQLKLAKRWKWSRNKTKKFLNDMEKEQQLIQQQSKSTSIITIINYRLYQQKGQQQVQQQDNSRATAGQQQDTNKNDKTVKNEKNKEEKEVFNEFRILYPGKKRGNETEFKDFTKKHKDWKEILPLLLPAIKDQIKHRENIPPGKFVPEWKYLKTWINQRNWEEEFETESDPNEWLKK